MRLPLRERRPALRGLVREPVLRVLPRAVLPGVAVRQRRRAAERVALRLAGRAVQELWPVLPELLRRRVVLQQAAVLAGPRLAWPAARLPLALVERVVLPQAGLLQTVRLQAGPLRAVRVPRPGVQLLGPGLLLRLPGRLGLPVPGLQVREPGRLPGQK